MTNTDFDDNCIFCKIVKGEVSAHKIWDDDEFLAFLSIQPTKPGHTLVIPKKHYPYIFDMEDEHISKLMLASKKVAQQLKKTLKPKTGKISAHIAGIDVPHVHIHLISLDKGGDLNLTESKNVTDEELSKVKDQILKN